MTVRVRVAAVLFIFVALFVLDARHVFGQRDQRGRSYQTIRFDSEDGLQVTADLYWKHNDKTKPFIVLCHQAGWSRGEYREIAPKLNELGFNCMAIDQRSGNEVNGVKNQTAERAGKTGKSTDYIDAEQDMIAALKHAKKNHANGPVILWGSSYSAALALRIAGENPELVNGVLAFAPGEYFRKFDKPGDWVASSAKKIEAPVFITSAKDEFKNWKTIYEAVESGDKVQFVPTTTGNHGSRALWAKFGDSGDYWKATESFLKKFQ